MEGSLGYGSLRVRQILLDWGKRESATTVPRLCLLHGLAIFIMRADASTAHGALQHEVSVELRRGENYWQTTSTSTMFHVVLDFCQSVKITKMSPSGIISGKTTQ
jgi:hypothetical protein